MPNEIEKPTSGEGENNSPVFVPVGNKAAKFGGILIFVAIGLILSLLQNLGNLMASLSIFRQEQIWQRLTTPGSPAYHPSWKPALLFELFVHSVVLGLNVTVAVLFFRKQREFPKVIVLTIPVTFALVLGSHYLSGFVPAVADSQGYSKGTEALIVRFIALHIWIPYFLVSKRVKDTFVR
jgi:hypothetical protein